MRNNLGGAGRGCRFKDSCTNIVMSIANISPSMDTSSPICRMPQVDLIVISSTMICPQ